MLKSKIFTKKYLNCTTKGATNNDREKVGEQRKKDSQRQFFSFHPRKVDGGNVKDGIGRAVEGAGGTGKVAVHAVLFKKLGTHRHRAAPRKWLD